MDRRKFFRATDLAAPWVSERWRHERRFPVERTLRPEICLRSNCCPRRRFVDERSVQRRLTRREIVDTCSRNTRSGLLQGHDRAIVKAKTVRMPARLDVMWTNVTAAVSKLRDVRCGSYRTLERARRVSHAMQTAMRALPGPAKSTHPPGKPTVSYRSPRTAGRFLYISRE